MCHNLQIKPLALDGPVYSQTGIWTPFFFTFLFPEFLALHIRPPGLSRVWHIVFSGWVYRNSCKFGFELLLMIVIGVLLFWHSRLKRIGNRWKNGLRRLCLLNNTLVINIYKITRRNDWQTVAVVTISLPFFLHLT